MIIAASDSECADKPHAHSALLFKLHVREDAFLDQQLRERVCHCEAAGIINIDFLKVDVQGAEYNVFSRAGHICLGHRIVFS
jgi:hypothetical protein